MRTRTLHVVLCGSLLLGMSSCATVRGWFGGGKGAEFPEPAGEAVEEVTREDYEDALRESVERYVQAAHRNRDEKKAAVRRAKPYYFKEYSVYPENAENLDIEYKETESRTRPVIAEVTLDRVRYSTRLHRKREDARQDDNFFRDTGAETLTYELRNGRWRRVGSLFVANKTEEYVNGEWVPRREEVERVLEAEERKGWFGRVWSTITGR